MTIRMLKIVACSVLLVTAAAARAEGSLSVTREAELNVAAGDLWNLVGKFGEWQKWHPAVAATEMTGDGTKPGDVRVLTLGDGAKIRETLEGYDAAGMQYSYTINESPLPVANYHSTLSVSAAGEGKANLTWTSTFDAAGVPDADAVGAIAGVYDGGIGALRDKYNQ